MRAFQGNRERGCARARVAFLRTMSVLCLNSVRQEPKRANSNLQICRIFVVFDGSSWFAYVAELRS